MTGIQIEKGYRPGLIGTVTRHFSEFFAQHCGFGAAFEIKVATEMADFVRRMDAAELELWHAHAGGRVLGSVFIDGQNLGAGKGHLRWFIVDPDARGHGLGAQLMSRAMAFCDAQGFEETQLWTIKGTDPARVLYERHGFVLAEEYVGNQWGAEAVEQRFVRQK